MGFSIPQGLPIQLSDVLKSIQIDTAYLPSFTIALDTPSDPNTSQEVKDLLAKVRPQITFHLAHGLQPVTVAPYGAPGPSQWPTVKTAVELGGAAFLGLLIFGVGSALLPRKR